MAENGRERWLGWAVELQSMAQSALAYCKDVYDIGRFERIREISAEMISHMSDIPLEKTKELFCGESGYQTPKLDTRAAVFDAGRILLVRENSGKWALPGGWCDVNLSVGENTVREVLEEAGMQVKPLSIIAVQDRAKHNLPAYAYGICKVFVLCELLGGSFRENPETTGCAFFEQSALPELAGEKSSREQLDMCFEALRAGSAWRTVFD